MPALLGGHFWNQKRHQRSSVVIFRTTFDTSALWWSFKELEMTQALINDHFKKQKRH